jgi:hypothetical protein
MTKKEITICDYCLEDLATVRAVKTFKLSYDVDPLTVVTVDVCAKHAKKIRPEIGVQILEVKEI